MDAKGLRAGGRGGRSGGIAGEVWLRAEKPRRDTLTRDRITAAAIELLDEHGTAHLTMRRLAERLDVAPPTLYWHVKTKDEVLDLAVDAIFGEVRIPDRTGDWAADARTLVLRWRATMLRHPWSPALIGRPMLGPNVLARTEFLQSTLARSGRTGQALAAATHGLANLTIGAALTESTWHGDLPQTSAHELIQANADRYPTLAATRHLDAPGQDALFDQAVRAFLTGLDQDT
ncbi:TetR/AcrR family transcriptional regulator [Actinophytocola sp. NPDC049390]|uniref:TetR/AcrR family transcriptional regulator n=1 Tax=Actinophytocola sp. NPDC049390 TaxID=3363894 RepID=UPI00379CB387